MKQIGLFDGSLVLSSFSCDRMEIIRGLRNVKRAIKFSRNDIYFIKCELYALEDKVVLRLDENEVFLGAQPVGFCKAEFYLKDALKALILDRSKEVEVSITTKTIKFNSVTLTVVANPIDYSVMEIPLNILKDDFQPIERYEPTLTKSLYTLDKTRGFSFFEVQQDIEVLNKILNKYKIDSGEIRGFIHSFLRSSL